MRTDATEALLSVTSQMEAGVPVEQLMIVGGGGTAVRVLGANGEPVALVPMSGTAVLATMGEAGADLGAGASGLGPTKTSERLPTDAATASAAAGYATFQSSDVLRVSDVAEVGGQSFTLFAEHPLAEVRRGVERGGRTRCSS